MSELKIMKMSNGDLLIAELVKVEDTTYHVLNPFKLEEQEENDNMIYFMDFWVPLDKTDTLISINGFHVVATTIPTEALTKYYDRVSQAMKQAGQESQLHFELEEDEDEFTMDIPTKPTIQ